jgi:plasmid stability protein
MAGITNLNIDDDLKPRLIERAVKHGHAMEVEAPEIKPVHGSFEPTACEAKIAEQTGGTL